MLVTEPLLEKKAATIVKVVLLGKMDLVCEELGRLLEIEPDIEVLQAACDDLSALSGIVASDPDVVVLDFPRSLCRAAGTIKFLHKCKPGLRIVLLSMQSDRRYLDTCLQAGANGYLLKECAGEELVEAVREVAADRPYLSRDLRAPDG